MVGGSGQTDVVEVGEWVRSQQVSWGEPWGWEVMRGSTRPLWYGPGPAGQGRPENGEGGGSKHSQAVCGGRSQRWVAHSWVGLGEEAPGVRVPWECGGSCGDFVAPGCEGRSLPLGFAGQPLRPGSLVPREVAWALASVLQTWGIGRPE